MKHTPDFDVMRDLLDDVELELSPQGLAITALLVGTGAWLPRVPALLRVMVRRLFGQQRVRVPIAAVTQIAEVIRLRSRATELGLGVLDRRTGRWLSRIPRT